MSDDDSGGDDLCTDHFGALNVSRRRAEHLASQELFPVADLKTNASYSADERRSCLRSGSDPSGGNGRHTSDFRMENMRNSLGQDLEIIITDSSERLWGSIDVAQVPKKLKKVRVNEGLIELQVAVNLDMPRKRSKHWKPRQVKVKRTARAKSSIVAEVEAFVRADAMMCSLTGGRKPTNAAVWDRGGRVTVFKSAVSGDGFGWMHEGQNGEEKDFPCMLANVGRHEPYKHYLCSEKT